MVPAVAFGSHSWGGYHWEGRDSSVTVADKMGSAIQGVSVPAAVADWQGALPADTLVLQVVSSNKGDISVELKGGSIQWLGLAQVFLDGGHITKGKVTLNANYVGHPDLGTNEWLHVLCQEIGHVIGLDHTTGNSCMNDSSGTLGDYTTSNSHDDAQLADIYSHWEDEAGASGSEEGGSGGNCPPNSKSPKCSAQGHWVTVHVFPAPGW